MPEPHIQNWVQLIVHATQEASERITTHSFATTPEFTDPNEAAQLAQDFWIHCGTAYKSAVSAGVNFDYVECRTLYEQPVNFSGIYFIPQPAPGFVTGEALPGNAAAGIRWKTGVRGRKFRGRNNIFGLTESQTTGSLLNANTGLVLANLAFQILTFTGTGGGSVEAVVASRVGNFLTEVLAFTIDSLVDSQRTRLLQRGN